MSRIPAHVLRRNRNNAEADRNAEYYARWPLSPSKVCACGHDEDDHFFGGRCERHCPCKRFEEAVCTSSS